VEYKHGESTVFLLVVLSSAVTIHNLKLGVLILYTFRLSIFCHITIMLLQFIDVVTARNFEAVNVIYLVQNL
jgi:hypothetical protein